MKNEDVVGAAPTGGAPTTSEWWTIQLPTKVRLILDTWRYLFPGRWGRWWGRGPRSSDGCEYTGIIWWSWGSCWLHKLISITSEPIFKNILDSKVHGANMGPTGGRQDPGGPHVDPMNYAIWCAECLGLVAQIRAFGLNPKVGGWNHPLWWDIFCLKNLSRRSTCQSVMNAVAREHLAFKYLNFYKQIW